VQSYGSFSQSEKLPNCIIFRFGGNYHSAKPTIILAEQDYHSSEARLTIRYFLHAKHKEPAKQELICDIEVEGMRYEDAVDERAERDEHNGNAEDMQSFGLYAAKSANARHEHQHAECGREDANEIEVEKAFESLDHGRNSGEYVDQRDYGSDLLVFAFCHSFIPSFFKIRRGRAAQR
jgi:hypothetical protein